MSPWDTEAPESQHVLQLPLLKAIQSETRETRALETGVQLLLWPVLPAQSGPYSSHLTARSCCAAHPPATSTETPTTVIPPLFVPEPPLLPSTATSGHRGKGAVTPPHCRLGQS